LHGPFTPPARPALCGPQGWDGQKDRRNETPHTRAQTEGPKRMDPNGCTQKKGTARKTSQKPARILRRLGENAEAPEPKSWVLTLSTHSLGDQSTPRRNRWTIHNLQKRFGDSSGATRRLGRLRKPCCNVSGVVSSASPGMSSGRKGPGSTRAAQLQTTCERASR